MSEQFDVLVVGAGPAGIAAATVAAESGCQVCLLDDNKSPGGQIWRGFRAQSASKYPHGHEFLRWTARLERSGCTIESGWEAVDQPVLGFLRLERDGRQRDVAFSKLILATGARERFLPFPGWTLPGVMGTGGLQAMVKSGLDPRGKRVVLAGSGPLLFAVGAGLASAGARVQGIYEQAPMARLAGFGLKLLRNPGKLVEGAAYRLKTLSVPYRTSSWIVRADGRGRVEHVTLTNGRTQWAFECDWVGCGFNLVPNLELPRLLGCATADGYVVVDRLQQSSVPGVACVGELTGIGGLEKALLEGRIAGLAAANRKADAYALEPRRQKLRLFAKRLDHAFALRNELRTLPEAQTIVCRCEDVSHAALQHCGGWREAKLHSRCGMGACQGRVCGVATEFLYGWQNASIRPPVFPAAVSTLAAATAARHDVHR